VNSASPLDIFAPGSAAVAVLLAMRLTGLVLVAPVFSATVVPGSVRTALIVLFTMLLSPIAAHAATTAPHVTPVAALGEMLVGFSIGLSVAIVVGAAEAAGDVIAVQIGLSGASLLDPLNNQTSPVLANFLSMFTVTLLLVLNVHLDMIAAIGASLKAIPVGTALDLQRGVSAMISLGGTLFLVGLRFAAPVIAAVMIGNAMLAVLTRAAPQLNILSVAFPLQIGLGLFAIAATVPFIGTYMGNWSTGIFESQVGTLFNAFLGGR
jgi:flagellar biosynthesis protein FliR